MRPGDDRILEQCAAPHCRMAALRADMVPARIVTNGRRTRGYYCATCAAYWGDPGGRIDGRGGRGRGIVPGHPSGNSRP